MSVSLKELVLDNKPRKLSISLEKEVFNCISLCYYGAKMINEDYSMDRIISAFVCCGFSNNRTVLLDKFNDHYTTIDLYNLFLDKFEACLDYLCENPKSSVYGEICRRFKPDVDFDVFIKRLLIVHEDFSFDSEDCEVLSRILTSPAKPIGKLKSYSFNEKIEKCYNNYMNALSLNKDAVDWMFNAVESQYIDLQCEE